jgi:hypothetical protein
MEGLVILTKSPGCTDQLQTRASELSDFTRESHFECRVSVWTYGFNRVVERPAKVADNYTVLELVRVKLADKARALTAEVPRGSSARIKPNNVTDFH